MLARMAPANRGGGLGRTLGEQFGLDGFKVLWQQAGDLGFICFSAPLKISLTRQPCCVSAVCQSDHDLCAIHP